MNRWRPRESSYFTAAVALLTALLGLVVRADAETSASPAVASPPAAEAQAGKAERAADSTAEPPAASGTGSKAPVAASPDTAAAEAVDAAGPPTHAAAEGENGSTEETTDESEPAATDEDSDAGEAEAPEGDSTETDESMETAGGETPEPDSGNLTPASVSSGAAVNSAGSRPASSASEPGGRASVGLRLRLAGLRRSITRYRAALREAQREMKVLKQRRRREPPAVAAGRQPVSTIDRAIVELNDMADAWSEDLAKIDALTVRLRDEREKYAAAARSGGGGEARTAQQCIDESDVLLNLLRVYGEALSANIELAGLLSADLSVALDKLAASGLLKVSDSRLTAATIREAGAECVQLGTAWRSGAGRWWRQHLQRHLLMLIAAVLLGLLSSVAFARGVAFLLAQWESRRGEDGAGRWRALIDHSRRPIAVGMGLLVALPLLSLTAAVHSVLAFTVVCLVAAVLTRGILGHWAAGVPARDAAGDASPLSERHARAVVARTMGVVWVNALFLPLLAMCRACEGGGGPLGLVLQLVYGGAFVLSLLVAAYGPRGWLALPAEEGTAGRRLRLAARLGLPVLLVGLAAVIGLRALGYYNLSIYLGRNLPFTALVLVGLGWLWRTLVPLSGRLVGGATRDEALAPDLTAALQRLLRMATIVTLLLVCAALLLDSWGRLLLTDRLAASAWLAAAGVAVGGLLSAVVLPWMLRPLHLLAGHWESALIRALSAPLFFACVLTMVRRGAALCLAGGGEEFLRRGYRGAVAALAVFALVRLVSALTTHYLELAAEQERTEVIPGVLLGRKVANTLLLALGATFVLWQAGFEVRPLLATLGIGSLAVAMALQDTLKNLFAGFYVMMDRSLKPGDFVSLDSGEQGFIEDIGWRNTKIRPYANNLIVIPNSKISEAVVTNENLPVEELSVYVACGVSYDSDLDEVERIAVEVARQTSASVEGAATNWEPLVRFKSFGDSNIDFLVILRVVNRDAQYVLTHEFIKALHRRFNEEGIVINYPVRDVIMRPAEPSADGGPA